MLSAPSMRLFYSFSYIFVAFLQGLFGKTNLPLYKNTKGVKTSRIKDFENRITITQCSLIVYTQTYFGTRQQFINVVH